MADLTFFLLGTIILAGFAGNIFFKVTKIPEALFLILGGILLGPVFHVIDQQSALLYASFFTALMLIVVLLDNGLSFDIFSIVKAIPATTVFSLGMVILMSGGIASVLHVLLSMSWLPAFVIALAMSGTTTDVVSVLLSRMHVRKEAKQLLVVESVLNDLQMIPFFILLALAMNISSGDYVRVILPLFVQIPLSLLLGIGAAMWWIYIIGRFLGKHPLNYVATIGILFIIYNTVQLFGGNGSLGILTFSLILGNAFGLFKKFHVKKEFRRKFTLSILKEFRNIEVDLSFFVKTGFFVFLGLAFEFEALQPRNLLVSFAILGVILVGRYLMARIISTKRPEYRTSIPTLTWIMPRGYVAAVLAFSAYGSGLFPRSVVDIVLLNIFLTTIVSILYSIYYEQTTKSSRK